ncbi:MAG: hypothetical protein KGJ50_10935 [Xanthomonadaceae bacterium]|nr:hypothetical protein [Xanthomonadaceae bacterium]
MAGSASAVQIAATNSFLFMMWSPLVVTLTGHPLDGVMRCLTVCCGPLRGGTITRRCPISARDPIALFRRRWRPQDCLTLNVTIA